MSIKRITSPFHSMLSEIPTTVVPTFEKKLHATEEEVTKINEDTSPETLLASVEPQPAQPCNTVAIYNKSYIASDYFQNTVQDHCLTEKDEQVRIPHKEKRKTHVTSSN